MRIPCDTIARLSHLLPDPSAPKVDEAVASFRLDNGKVIVTNRCFMAVESVESFKGVFYIKADPALIEQCRTEAQYSSTIEFTPIEALKYTTAITSMGFKISENIGVWPDKPSDFDKWYENIVKPCLEPLTASGAPMVFNADSLHRLALASPSGGIVLEQYADPATRPTVVRDIDSGDWVGFFKASVADGKHHASATVPGWCK